MPFVKDLPHRTALYVVRRTVEVFRESGGVRQITNFVLYHESSVSATASICSAMRLAKYQDFVVSVELRVLVTCRYYRAQPLFLVHTSDNKVFFPTVFD